MSCVGVVFSGIAKGDHKSITADKAFIVVRDYMNFNYPQHFRGETDAQFDDRLEKMRDRIPTIRVAVVDIRCSDCGLRLVLEPDSFENVMDAVPAVHAYKINKS